MSSSWHTQPGVGVLDARYVNVTGDTMTGQLVLGLAGVGLSVTQDSVMGGYLRVGSVSSPTNTTAGDITGVRLKVGDGAFGTGVELSVTGDGALSGFLRVGSETAPTNTTAGDLTAARLKIGDGAFGTGVEASITGDGAISGFLQVGSETAPSNTTAGDITALRIHVGTDSTQLTNVEADFNCDVGIQRGLSFKPVAAGTSTLLNNIMAANYFGMVVDSNNSNNLLLAEKTVSATTARWAFGHLGEFGIGQVAPASLLHIGSALTKTSWTTNGIAVRVDAATYTNSSAGSATYATAAAISLAQPTYAASNASTVVTDAANLYIANAPVAGTNMALTNAWALWVDDGSSRFDGRVVENQGADVSSANNLVLGSDGNSWEITGTTQINLISNLGWQNGSIITLLFTSTPTVKHNQTTSSTNISIKLAGAVDFAATAGDTLTLLLSEIGGTQGWREIGRAVI